MKGRVLWFDLKDGFGTIEDNEGNEYYVSAEDLIDPVRTRDSVSFSISKRIGYWCAVEVKILKEEKKKKGRQRD